MQGQIMLHLVLDTGLGLKIIGSDHIVQDK